MSSLEDGNHSTSTKMNTVRKGKSPYTEGEAAAATSETAGLLDENQNQNGHGDRRHGDGDGSTTFQAQASRYWISFKDSISSLIPNSRKSSKRRSTDDDDDDDESQSPHPSSSSPSLGSRFHSFKSKHPNLLLSFISLSLLFLLLILFYAFILIHLLFFTLSPPNDSIKTQILDSSILLKGPDSISLLNISDDGILISLQGRLGLDPDRALDLYLGEKKNLGWLKRKERDWIEWSIGKIGGIQIETGEIVISEPDWKLDLKEDYLGILDPKKKNKKHQEEESPSSLSLSAKDDDDDNNPPLDLLSFHIQPLIIPLPNLSSNKKHASNPHLDQDQEPILGGNHSTHKTHQTLNPLNLTLLLRPVSEAPEIMKVVKKAIKKKKAILDLDLKSLRIRGIQRRQMKENEGDRKIGGGIAGWVDVRQNHIIKRLAEKIPNLKNATDPDKGDFLNLTRYDFFEINSGKSKSNTLTTALPTFKNHLENDLSTLDGPRALGIKAVAEAKNPLGKVLHGHIGYNLPLGIYLPVEQPDSTDDGNKDKVPKNDSTVLLAAVATEPLIITGEKKIELEILGRVVPPPTGKSSEKKIKSSSLNNDEINANNGWGKIVSQLIFGGNSGPGSLETSDELEISKEDGGIHLEEDTPQQVALSGFLSRFLRGDPNTVYVRGGSPFHVETSIINSTSTSSEKSISTQTLPGDGSILPSWLDSSLRLIDLPISFPGSKVTELIKNVTIQDLKITPHPFEKEKLLASGIVLGEMNLPGQLATIDVQITDLWPDIVVYDGKPPALKNGKGDKKRPDDGTGDGDDDDDDFYFSDSESYHYENQSQDAPSDPVPALPAPNSKNAFGRVRPHDFSPAETITDPNDPKGEKKLLRSELKNVPFQVLDGKGPIFRSFTWKLVTGEGALAGIQGASRAKIWNSGLGKLELKNLPVKGAFVVGKRGGNGGDDDDDDD